MEKLGTVLLVDDDYVDNYLNKQILERTRIAEEVVICESALEALKILKKLQPQLILLDINMPVMNGLELLEALKREELPECSVAMLTASSHPDDLAKAAELRVNYYLVKPLTEEKVIKMVERCFYSPGETQDGVKS